MFERKFGTELSVCFFNTVGSHFSFKYFTDNSKCIEGSTHYLGDKQGFDVSSKGPSSGISTLLCYLSTTHTGNG